MTLKAVKEIPNPQEPCREHRVRRVRRNGGVYLTVVLLTSFSILTGVLLLWMRKGMEEILSARSRELPIIVVLKDEIGEAAARSMAERLKKENGSCEINALSRAEAKALLSIHEPWFKEFQDVALVEPPCLIEIRDPALLAQPKSIEKRLAELQVQPEVEFVIFNSVGLDDAVRFIGALRRHANILVVVILATLFVFNAVFWGVTSWVGGRTSLSVALVQTLFVVTLAALLAGLWWELILKFGLHGVPTLSRPPILFFALVSAWLVTLYFAVTCVMSLFAPFRRAQDGEDA
ncbi:MAG: hypothetical protein KatS3mg130_1223 [Candidatus Sumerlaea sp.]|nr:hypothetical protein [Candidatus Sumerlaea chitinivorans]GIX44815.1 MAG: hypothetical protein KatS3mg130_1223 [Candidatus Sumerlaea sp.]